MLNYLQNFKFTFSYIVSVISNFKPNLQWPWRVLFRRPITNNCRFLLITFRLRFMGRIDINIEQNNGWFLWQFLLLNMKFKKKFTFDFQNKTIIFWCWKTGCWGRALSFWFPKFCVYLGFNCQYKITILEHFLNVCRDCKALEIELSKP